MLTAPLAFAAPTEAEKETARSLMDQGDALAAKADWQAALRHYQAAHEIMGVPTTGIEVARVQVELGRLLEARSTALAVAHAPSDTAEPAVFTEARASAAILAQELEGRIPSLVIDVVPQQAVPRVRIDDVELPAAALGLPFKVNPGRHVVRASAAGYAPAEREVSVSEGQQKEVHFTLGEQRGAGAALDPSAPVANGSGALEVSGKPGALDSPSEAATTRGVIALGVAGAAGLVGAGAGIYSWMKVNEARDNHCIGNRCTSEAEPLLDQATTSAWVANVGVGVAVVALAYGMYELVFNSPAQPSASGLATRKRAQAVASERGALRPLAVEETSVSFATQENGATLWWSGAF